MPVIKSSTDLRNNYNKISSFCHESREPVFITKNGRGDLAVMSIEAYEMLIGKIELFQLLDEGMESIKAGQTRSFSEVAKELRKELTDERIPD